MKRLGAVIALTAALAAAVGGSGTASASSWTNCGQYGLEGDVLVQHTSCSTGRSLIKIFLIRSQSEGPNLSARGFDCTGKLSGSRFLVNCHKGAKRVHWRGAIS